MIFNSENKSKWIWIDSQSDGINQYVEFRHGFKDGGKSSELTAHISVDSDYELWVNGHFVGWNQYPNWPSQKTFNTYNVSKFVKIGQNCIAIRVYYRGENFATYAKGKPGLIFTLTNENNNMLLISDSSWKCRLCQTYKSGIVPKLTVQLGFTIEYDARKDDSWRLTGYDDNLWDRAVEISNATDGYWESISLRPIKPLFLGDPISSRVVETGYIRRGNDLDSVALTMASDIMEKSRFHKTDDEFLLIGNVPEGKGAYVIFDLGSQQAGLLDICLDAISGTIVDIAHGEHLDDNRVRCHINGRNFADRYIAKRGLQSWLQPYRRLGCRYLQIHIPEVVSPIKIYNITVRPVKYTFKRAKKFRCDDSMLNDIWDISVQTLELCAHEHYEDCPWREQALYACDGRLQALFGYYTFEEYDFPALCWDILGGGLRDDGLLEMNAPAKVSINIPSFSLHWIIALRELLDHSGQKQLIAKHPATIMAILDTALGRLSKKNIVANSQNSDHWHFYEWSDGLFGDFEACLAEKKSSLRFDAIYNLLLIDALNSASVIGTALGNDKLINYSKGAKVIADSFHVYFWDEQWQLYASFVFNDKRYHYAQLTQALAITQNVIPQANLTNQLCKSIIDDKSLVTAGLSSLYYIYDALLTTDLKYLDFVLDDIKNKFGNMVQAGATSLWETVDGSSAFENAGSLCHGWSSVFNYIAGAYILGVKPVEHGFTKFSFQPAQNLISFASGDVPTLEGAIRIAWDVRSDKNTPEIIYSHKLKIV